MGYCGVGLMSVWTTVLMGVVMVELMSIGLLSAGKRSGQVTVWLGYFPVRLLFSQDTALWVSVNQAAVCQKCVLGEVSSRLLSSRATVRIPKRKTIIIYD